MCTVTSSPKRGVSPTLSSTTTIADAVDVILREGVRQRSTDGYINATDLCKKFSKLWGNYWKSESTKEFIKGLYEHTILSVEDAIQISIPGSLEGTWV